LASTRADKYDGIFARITEVYSDRCISKVKRQKMHRNEGCAVAKILGNRVYMGIVSIIINHAIRIIIFLVQ
jgi:hypothetical protein